MTPREQVSKTSVFPQFQLAAGLRLAEFPRPVPKIPQRIFTTRRPVDYLL